VHDLKVQESERKTDDKVEAVLKYLKNPGVLTTPRLENGLKRFLPKFLVYVRERYFLQLPDGVSVDSLAKNKDLLEHYKNFLTVSAELSGIKDNTHINFKAADNVLSSLYQGNIDQIASGLIQPLAYQQIVKEWEGRLDGLKSKLIAKIDEEKGTVRTVFKQIVKAGLNKTKEATAK